MNKSKYTTTNAIILKTNNSGEINKYFTFISPELGVSHAVAYGAAKSKSRFCAGVQNFVKAKLFLHKNPKTNQLKLEDIAEVEINDVIKTDLKFIYTASFFIELILNTYISNEEYKNFYYLLLYSLEIIKDLKDNKKAVLFFTSKFLFLSGYNFNLKCCKKCLKAFDFYFFDLPNHGLFCENDTINKKFKMSAESASLLQEFLEKKYLYLKELTIDPVLFKEIIPVIEEIINNVFEKKLKTFIFLKEYL